MTSKLKFLTASALGGIAMLSSGSAFAAGTLQGVDINNTVSVSFSVGGVAQTAQTASDTFKVDRKVIFTVQEATPTGTTSVSPGATGQITTFLVSNTSNDTLDFNLAATQLAGGTAAHGGTDVFDVTGLQFFVDVNNNGTYEAGTDTATVIDNLAPDASRRVFILGNIPSTATNGQVAGVTLTATARNSDGSAITAATDATANTTAVETIFADTGRDGVEAAGDDYTVAGAVLSVSKLSRVVSDGVSASNPKAIPGAVIEYCIAVSNAAGAATATGVNITDNLSLIPNVTYDATFTPKMNGTAVTGSTCTPGADNGTYTGGTNTVSGTLNNIAAGQTRTFVFRVTIN
ncbi:hypothetical protein LPB140_07000 [Sphingorhabdus lutea]|uniref:DUF11 domain-containing protein n=1 Tax=Sphingorhabdus lutea TaxID=1913578 RepID=A0A1L3JBY1_9SPHN|nr:hypothetical protein [Sphingorhabdus lutea]APG62573.1 hypothetical protein LPB140_07000 [Sphingorhabdus lutea]